MSSHPHRSGRPRPGRRRRVRRRLEGRSRSSSGSRSASSRSPRWSRCRRRTRRATRQARRPGGGPAIAMQHDHSAHAGRRRPRACRSRASRGRPRRCRCRLPRRAPRSTRRSRPFPPATSSGPHDAQGHDRPDRSRHRVRDVGVQQPRHARPDPARPPGADRRDDAHQRRQVPHSIDSTPHASHRTWPSRTSRRATRSRFRFVAERARRVHVPLRDEAGAGAHRERHVRRTGRRPSDTLPKADHEYVLVASECT